MKQTPGVAESAEKSRGQKPMGKQETSQPQPQGTPWQLYFVLTVILLGVIGLVGKVLGLF